MIHSLNHTALVVDITNFGLPTKIFPPEGDSEMVLAIRFQTWKDAERYFLRLGADSALLEKTREQLKKAGVTVLTIL